MPLLRQLPRPKVLMTKVEGFWQRAKPRSASYSNKNPSSHRQSFVRRKLSAKRYLNKFNKRHLQKAQPPKQKRYLTPALKHSLRLTQHRMIRVGIIISIASVATHSLSANAGILDPIRRVFSSLTQQEHTDTLSESDQLITEQQPLDPNITSHPVQANEGQLSARDRPSLLNVMQAEFLVDRGDIYQALALYKQEALKRSATSVFERTLELSLLYESATDSLAFTQQWQQQNPEHVPALFYIAHLALKSNNYPLAGDTLSQILILDSMADLSEILIGIYPATESDQRLLLETLLALPKHNNPSLLVMQAGLLSQLGSPEIALLSINRALESQPDTPAFISLKADILKQLEAENVVLDYISEERKRLADNKSLYLYEIRYRLELGQTTQAWELLLQAHDLFNDDEMTLLAALVSIDLEAYTEADQLLSNLASSPYYLDQAYYYLGISAERQQKFNRAERFFSKVMQESLVLSAREKLVDIQLLAGHPEKALASLEKFSQQFPVYAPGSSIMQAEILRQQNKLEDAKKLLAQTNQQFPDDTKLLYARAQLLTSEQDVPLKRMLLERLVLLDPENIEYRLTWATLLSQIGNEEETKQALDFAQAIVELPFESPLFSQGNYISALNILASDALVKEDYNAVINYLELTYDMAPNLDSGIILLRAYQGLNQEDRVNYLFEDIQNRFALGQQAISDRLQSY